MPEKSTSLSLARRLRQGLQGQALPVPVRVLRRELQGLLRLVSEQGLQGLPMQLFLPRSLQLHM